MRTLKFIVNNQSITPDPQCDFSNITPGTEGHLTAEFTFSKDWNGYVKAATFYSLMGTEYTPQILKDGKSCVIPAEALKRRVFKIQVFGKKGDVKIQTNRITVKQDGGIK